jgi:hypothetical protein
MNCERGRKQKPQGHKQAPKVSSWARYEAIKQQLVANASTSAEYEAACREAARLARV